MGTQLRVVVIVPILKRIPVPTFLVAGLYAGYSGNFPVVGVIMDAPLAEIDVAIFEFAKQPTLFVFFLGLLTAFGAYLIIVVWILGRKKRARIKLSRIRDDATEFLNAAVRRQVLLGDDREKIEGYEADITKNAEIISKDGAGIFRTLLGFDPNEIPREFRISTAALHFAERLRRIEPFLKDHR